MWSPNLEGPLPEWWHYAARALAVGPAGQSERNSYEVDWKAAAKFAFSVRCRRAPREFITVRPFHQAFPGQALSEGGLAVLPGTLACEGLHSRVAGFALNSPETPEVNHVVAALWFPESACGLVLGTWAGNRAPALCPACGLAFSQSGAVLFRNLLEC